MSTTTALATTAPVKRAKSATAPGFSKSTSKPIEVVRVPGQFDRVDQDLVVATPTCCCCCCCLVTTFSALAYSSAILTAETRKQNDPVARRFWFGFAGFFTPIVASTISSALLAIGHARSWNLIASTVLYIAVFTGLMLVLVGKASRNTRSPKQVATECALFTLIAGVCLLFRWVRGLWPTGCAFCAVSDRQLTWFSRRGQIRCHGTPSSRPQHGLSCNRSSGSDRHDICSIDNWWPDGLVQC
jgi:hypothetical protein